VSDLRWRRFWLGLWIFGMLLGLFLSLRRGGDELPLIPHLDKLIHATGYAILASLAVCLFEKPGPRWRALLWVILLGGLIEIAQGLLPTGRSQEGGRQQSQRQRQLLVLVLARIKGPPTSLEPFRRPLDEGLFLGGALYKCMSIPC